MTIDEFEENYNNRLLKIKRNLPNIFNNEYEKDAYILMLYAYWEGFVNDITKDFFKIINENPEKFCTEGHFYYLNQINNNKKGFKGFICFKKIKSLFFKHEKDMLIDTNSNLGYEIFRYFLFILNISENKEISSNLYTKRDKNEENWSYLSKSSIIDVLLKKRNQIAHGEEKILQDDFIKKDELENFSHTISVILTQFYYDICEKLRSF